MMEDEFSKFCRICLSEKIQLVNCDAVEFVFQLENDSKKEDVSLDACLDSIGIQIPSNEIKYSKICLICTREVEIAGKLKYKAFESEKKIRERFGNSSNKRKSAFDIENANKKSKQIETVLVVSEPNTMFPNIKIEPGLETSGYEENYLHSTLSDFEKKMQEQLEMNRKYMKKLADKVRGTKNGKGTDDEETDEEAEENEKEEETTNRQKKRYGLRSGRKRSYKAIESGDESVTDDDSEYVDDETNGGDVESIKSEKADDDESAGPSDSIHSSSLKEFRRKKLPMTKKEEFLEFERNVQESYEYQNYWINFIDKFRKHSSYKKGVDAVIKTVLQRLMTDHVMANFTWTGVSSSNGYVSIAIRYYKTIEILTDRMVEFFPQAGQEYVEKAIAARFRSAKSCFKKDKKIQQDPTKPKETKSISATRQLLENLHSKGSPLLQEKREFDQRLAEYKSISADKEFSTNFFPIVDKDEFLKFEEVLRESQDWRIKFRAFIRDYVNKNSYMHYTKFLKNTIKRVVKDSAACYFTWSGVKANIKLQGMKFISILENIALEVYPNEPLKNIQEVIKVHFRDSKMRINNKVQWAIAKPTEETEPKNPEDGQEQSMEKLKFIQELMIKTIERVNLFDNSQRPEGYPECLEFPFTDRNEFIKFETVLHVNMQWQEFTKQFLTNNRSEKDKTSFYHFVVHSYMKIVHPIVSGFITWEGRFEKTELNKYPIANSGYSLAITKIIQKLTHEFFPHLQLRDVENETKKTWRTMRERYNNRLRSLTNQLETQDLGEFMTKK